MLDITMMSQGLLLFIILAGIQPGVQASEVSEELQLLQKQFLGMQKQMETGRQQMETMQQQMATEKQEMQQQMATEKQQIQQEIQQQMATEREKIQQQMTTTVRIEMQKQMATEREEMQQQMATERGEMQQQIATERQARQEEMEKMQLKVEKMQQQMATEREALKHEMFIERQEMHLTMRKHNNTLKHNIININVQLSNVVHENQLLGEIVSVLKQNVSLGFENMYDMVGQAVNRKHNGSCLGFSAYPSETRDYTDGVTVLFDSVITNVGSLYTPGTSIFICGYQGYYLFSVSVYAATGDVMAAELVMDGTSIAYVYADQADSDSSSNTVVVLCPQFSQVYVRARQDGLTMWGSSDSMFTGFLLLQQ